MPQAWIVVRLSRMLSVGCPVHSSHYISGSWDCFDDPCPEEESNTSQAEQQLPQHATLPLCVLSMPGPMLEDFYKLSHLILLTTPQNRHYNYPHFLEEKTEAWEDLYFPNITVRRSGSLPLEKVKNREIRLMKRKADLFRMSAFR